MKEQILTSKTPQLDLHGEIVNMVNALVNEFIKDNYLMGNNLVRIIHGKSTNTLKNEVHFVLKSNPYIIRYKLNNFNIGETIVIIKDK